MKFVVTINLCTLIIEAQCMGMMRVRILKTITKYFAFNWSNRHCAKIQDYDADFYRRKYFVTARIRRMGKVMFLQVSVCQQGEGDCGGGGTPGQDRVPPLPSTPLHPP